MHLGINCGVNHLTPSSALVIGPELVTNGTFDVDANWTKGTGWTISGGVANADGTGTFTDLTQTIGTTLVNGTYRISLTVNRTSGNGALKLAGHNILFGGASALQASGTFTTDYVLSGVVNNAVVLEMNPFVGTVDNVSVKKIG